MTAGLRLMNVSSLRERARGFARSTLLMLEMPSTNSTLVRARPISGTLSSEGGGLARETHPRDGALRIFADGRCAQDGRANPNVRERVEHTICWRVESASSLA
ncbi:hypothetical protein PT2222_290104 [Paraburkholderia tropica]